VAFDRLPKYLVIDDFLPAAFHAELLAYALASQSEFAASEVIGGGTSVVDTSLRQSQICRKGLGPHKAAFKAAIRAKFEELPATLGMTSFTVSRIETQLIAHGDGAFYKRHIDTRVGTSRKSEITDRVLSMVYYFHQEPKRFSGGEIALCAFGPSNERIEIAPAQNRLVAFPSFVAHEVKQVSCPSKEYADSRFAINCWLHKDALKPAD
jgi:SM-20-related protein